MRTYARIENNVIVEILKAPMLPAFHPSLIWMDAPEEVDYGWTVSGGSLVPPPPLLLEEVKTDKLLALAAKRWAVETGGILINGAKIHTDIDTQTKISGALQLVNRVPETLIDWKAATGWIQLSKEDVEAIADRVGQHIQACFSRERSLTEAIMNAGNAEDVEAIDINSGWPS